MAAYVNAEIARARGGKLLDLGVLDTPPPIHTAYAGT